MASSSADKNPVPASDDDESRLLTPRAVVTTLLRSIGTTPAVGYDMLPRDKRRRKLRPRHGAGSGGGEEDGDEEDDDDGEKDVEEEDDNDDEDEEPQRSALPSSHRRLIMTLHSILPDLVLPALDLLDRGLVTRLIREGERTPSQDVGVYIVRSLASTIPRRGREQDREDDEDDEPSTKAPKRHVVRVGAWNCTCRGFALSTVGQYDQWQGAEGEAVEGDRDVVMEYRPEDVEEEEDSTDEGGGPGRGTFGGLCLDGLDRGMRFYDVPCCKHLFACLLAESWSEVLESRVRVRQVAREEVAGLMASV